MGAVAGEWTMGDFSAKGVRSRAARQAVEVNHVCPRASRDRQYWSCTDDLAAAGRAHRPPSPDVDRILDEANGTVSHGHVDASRVPAPRGVIVRAARSSRRCREGWATG